MIVDPDFIDHWRTRMLVDLLDGDEMAPLYVIRILSHCQNRKKTQIEPMQNPGLKALCRYAGDAEKLESALVESEYIIKTENGYSVPKFAEHNAQLINSWANGSKGGRPKKKPTVNPPETHDKPKANPREPEKRREEKSREELIKEKDKKEKSDPQPDGSGPPPDPKVPNSEKLDELISAFEALPPGIGHKIQNRRGKEILKGWRRVQRDPEWRQAFEDIPKLMARIRDGTYLHGQGWFRFVWLFATGKTGEKNVLKILEDRYDERKKGAERKNPARIHSESKPDSFKLLDADREAKTGS